MRIDIAADRLLADVARLQRRPKGAVVESALGLYVAEHRDELRSALDRSLARIDDAEDPHRVDPETGLTRAGWDELWRALR